jgi:signal transduction histidine kinase
MFGLNISKMIVAKYDGTLFFKSKINQGSTFGFIMDMKNPEH